MGLRSKNRYLHCYFLINFFLKISISEGHFISQISRFFNFAQARQGCQLHLCSAEICLREFYFSVENFFFNISILECRKGEAEVSTALTLCPVQFASIFIFQSKYFQYLDF